MTKTTQLRNSFKEMPGGLRREQQQAQLPSKLGKLIAHQNTPRQAGGEHLAF